MSVDLDREIHVTDAQLRTLRGTWDLLRRAHALPIAGDLLAALLVVMSRAGYVTEAGCYIWDDERECWAHKEQIEADRARAEDLASWHVDMPRSGKT